MEKISDILNALNDKNITNSTVGRILDSTRQNVYFWKKTNRIPEKKVRRFYHLLQSANIPIEYDQIILMNHAR